MKTPEAASVSLMRDRLGITAATLNTKLISVNILKEQLDKKKKLCQLV